MKNKNNIKSDMNRLFCAPRYRRRGDSVGVCSYYAANACRTISSMSLLLVLSGCLPNRSDQCFILLIPTCVKLAPDFCHTYLCQWRSYPMMKATDRCLFTSERFPVAIVTTAAAVVSFENSAKRLYTGKHGYKLKCANACVSIQVHT